MAAPIRSKTEVNSAGVAEGINKTSTQDETATPKIPVVRTLKPPPEIWQLVQPAPPRQFKPGRVFIGRLASSRSMVILLAGVVVLIAVYIGLQGGKRIAGLRNTPVVPSNQVDTTKTRVGDSNKPSSEHNAQMPGVALDVDQPTGMGSENFSRKRTPRGREPIGAVTQVDNGPLGTAKTTTAIKSGSSLERSQVSQPTDQKLGTKSLTNSTKTAEDDSSDSLSNRKAKTALSPQLIDSPKTSSPRNAKVINWP